MNFVDIGFSNYVDVKKIITVSRPDSSPIRRLIALSKDEGRFVDLTQGKKTRSIIIANCGDDIIVHASAVQTTTVISRINKMKGKITEVFNEDIIEVTAAATE